MFEHVFPLESQRRHWYANVNGAVPDQVPFEVVNVDPSRAVPVIDGGAVFDGGTTGAVTLYFAFSQSDMACRFALDIEPL